MKKVINFAFIALLGLTTVTSAISVNNRSSKNIEDSNFISDVVKENNIEIIKKSAVESNGNNVITLTYTVTPEERAGDIKCYIKAGDPNNEIFSLNHKVLEKKVEITCLQEFSTKAYLRLEDKFNVDTFAEVELGYQKKWLNKPSVITPQKPEGAGNIWEPTSNPGIKVTGKNATTSSRQQAFLPSGIQLAPIYSSKFTVDSIGDIYFTKFNPGKIDFFRFYFMDPSQNVVENGEHWIESTQANAAYDLVNQYWNIGSSPINMIGNIFESWTSAQKIAFKSSQAMFFIIEFDYKATWEAASTMTQPVSGSENQTKPNHTFSGEASFTSRISFSKKVYASSLETSVQSISPSTNTILF